MIIKLHENIDENINKTAAIWINSEYILSFNESCGGKNTQIYLSGYANCYTIVTEKPEDIAKMLDGNNNA